MRQQGTRGTTRHEASALAGDWDARIERARCARRGRLVVGHLAAVDGVGVFYLLQDGRWEAAKQMCSSEVQVIAPRDQEPREFIRSLRLEMVGPRKWLEVARARQGFRLIKETGQENGVYRAERGRVLPSDQADRRVPYSMH